MEDSVSKKIVRFSNGSRTNVTDLIAAEAPMQLIVNGKPLSITMRTPGSDVELGAGFLWTERLIEHQDDIISHKESDQNTVEFSTRVQPFVEFESKNFFTTSSCGVCGKSTVDEIMKSSPFSLQDSREIHVQERVICSLPEKLRNHQSAFNQTGGIHGCALFDVDGNIFKFAEDVGRHNALDKLIGHYVLRGQLPLPSYILLLSGRISFELVQKSIMAGIKIVCGIGAPSDLAIDTAHENGQTLVGFLKKDSFNIYTHPKRIIE